MCLLWSRVVQNALLETVKVSGEGQISHTLPSKPPELNMNIVSNIPLRPSREPICKTWF